MILVTPKQEVERKREWLWGVKFFHSIFKVCEKVCLSDKIAFEQKIRSLANGFLFIAAF